MSTPHIGDNLKNLFQRTDVPTPPPATEQKHQDGEATTRPRNTRKKSTRTAETPATPPTTAPAPVPGRPRQHIEPMDRVPLDIPVRQIVYLDTISTTIRSHGGPSIKRVHILRAMLDAIEESSLDLSTASTREDIKTMIAARLAGR